MAEVPPHVMQTIQTTEMILSSARRVCSPAMMGTMPLEANLMRGVLAVCVSSVLIDEIKRIIKQSEIMK